MAKAAPKTKKAKGPKVGVAIRKTSAAPKKALPKKKSAPKKALPKKKKSAPKKALPKKRGAPKNGAQKTAKGWYSVHFPADEPDWGALYARGQHPDPSWVCRNSRRRFYHD